MPTASWHSRSAERLGIAELATLDRRHFSVVRPRHVDRHPIATHSRSHGTIHFPKTGVGGQSLQGTQVDSIGPADQGAYGLSVALEVLTVTNEEVLAEAVRAWADQARPADRGAPSGRSGGAELLSRGSRVSGARREASGFVQSWSHHPAHMSPAHDVVLRLVS
jgi:hypothetical protein